MNTEETKNSSCCILEDRVFDEAGNLLIDWIVFQDGVPCYSALSEAYALTVARALMGDLA